MALDTAQLGEKPASETRMIGKWSSRCEKACSLTLGLERNEIARRLVVERVDQAVEKASSGGWKAAKSGFAGVPSG